MQNRYTGDIGDFSKLGLLRALRATGLSIGLNWYLTPDETHNSDGRHVGYLKQEKYRKCDEELWLGLQTIVEAGQREVRYMENDNILQATFFSNCLDFAGEKKPERFVHRQKWFAESLEVMAGKDIVCVDPDNGLIVSSAAGRPKENKYVLPEELASYYAQGSTVIYYQHKARYKDDHYVNQLHQLLKSPYFPDAAGFSLKFKTTSQRYYMFIIHLEHKTAIEKAVKQMLSTEWGNHFSYLPI